jgi:hypothetical protein
MKKVFVLISCLFWSLAADAQLSNAQIIKMKTDADDGKGLWIKLFEEGFAKGDMSALPALRKTDENFLNQSISTLSRLYAEGDGRELVLTIKNYLSLEKQFVRSIMIPAESLKPGDNAGYDALNKEISEFAKKERSFDMDITNSVRNSPEPLQVPQESEYEEPEQDAATTATDENITPKKRGRLPHEKAERKSRKKHKKETENETEEE